VKRLLRVFFVLVGGCQVAQAQFDDANVMLCAHRGGMYDDHAENSVRTLEFLAKSFGDAPVMAEIDIRKSKNGTLFLLHDNTLERTTTGTGEIGEATDEYLRSLRLRTGNGNVTEESIPTFADVLDFAVKRNIFLMLDVKIDDWRQVLNLVKSRNATRHCVVLTFTPENSRKVHELSSEIMVSCLVKDRKDWNEISNIVPAGVMLAYVNESTPDDVLKEMKSKSIRFVTDASEATRNNSRTYPSDFYKTLISNGINILVTDLPNEVNSLLN
jgi:glycerophosphoryl diester phosphodiesterase